MGHVVVVHLPVIPVFQQIPPQFPAMLNTRIHPRPDGLASVSAKNVEIPSEKHKTKNSAKVAGIEFCFANELMYSSWTKTAVPPRP